MLARLSARKSTHLLIRSLHSFVEPEIIEDYGKQIIDACPQPTITCDEFAITCDFQSLSGQNYAMKPILPVKHFYDAMILPQERRKFFEISPFGSFSNDPLVFMKGIRSSVIIRARYISVRDDQFITLTHRSNACFVGMPGDSTSSIVAGTMHGIAPLLSANRDALDTKGMPFHTSNDTYIADQSDRDPYLILPQNQPSNAAYVLIDISVEFSDGFGRYIDRAKVLKANAKRDVAIIELTKTKSDHFLYLYSKSEAEKVKKELESSADNNSVMGIGYHVSYRQFPDCTGYMLTKEEMEELYGAQSELVMMIAQKPTTVADQIRVYHDVPAVDGLCGINLQYEGKPYSIAVHHSNYRAGTAAVYNEATFIDESELD